jgi:hypothetical protein
MPDSPIVIPEFFRQALIASGQTFEEVVEASAPVEQELVTVADVIERAVFAPHFGIDAKGGLDAPLDAIPHIRQPEFESRPSTMPVHPPDRGGGNQLGMIPRLDAVDPPVGGGGNQLGMIPRLDAVDPPVGGGGGDNPPLDPGNNPFLVRDVVAPNQFSPVDDVLIPLDIQINRQTGGGDETISARVGRREGPVERGIADALDYIDPGHSFRAVASSTQNRVPRIPRSMNRVLRKAHRCKCR